MNTNTNKRIRVVYAGRMTTVKGVLELFKVARAMKNIDFLFAGPGELVDKLKEEVSKNHFLNISILGMVGKAKLYNIFANSDIFVLPSYHSEGIPIALLEAGAAKLAVIACNVGGINEAIEHNKTGLLIKPRNEKALWEALDKLIHDKLLRKKLASSLFIHIKKNFSWKETHARILFSGVH